MEIWLSWADPHDLAGVGDLVEQGWDGLEIWLCQDVSQATQMIWFGCRFGWTTMLDISLDVGRRFAGLDMWLSLHLVGSEIWLDWNWDG